MKVLLFCVAVAVVIGYSEAIKCYSCSLGENCKEGECEGKYCFKKTGNAGEAKAVFKGCQETGGDSCSSTSIGGGSVAGASCTCDSSWCNAAMNNAKIATSMLALTVVATFGLRKMLLN